VGVAECDDTDADATAGGFQTVAVGTGIGLERDPFRGKFGYPHVDRYLAIGKQVEEQPSGPGLDPQ